jgi:hypothetical protein
MRNAEEKGRIKNKNFLLRESQVDQRWPAQGRTMKRAQKPTRLPRN